MVIVGIVGEMKRNIGISINQFECWKKYVIPNMHISLII